MNTGLGFNLHVSHISDGYWAQLMQRFVSAPPRALLLLDSFGVDNPEAAAKAEARAFEVERLLPNTTLIFRRYMGDNYHLDITPEQWRDRHSALIGHRIYVSALNEPTHPDMAGTLDWLLRAAKVAKAAGLRISLGGWSVGGYEVQHIPLMRPLLEYSAANPGVCVWDFHEYTRGLVYAEVAPDAHAPADWPTTVNPEALWLMGRYKRVYAYCDRERIPRPRIVVGEWGWDRVRAIPDSLYGDVEGVNTCGALWSAWGQEPGRYGADQLRSANRVIYREPEIIGQCFYQLSDRGSGNWPTFNAAELETFMQNTTEGFDAMTTPTPTPKPYPVGTYSLNGSSVRVRESVSTTSTILTTVNGGDAVQVLSIHVDENGGYGWQRVSAGGMSGFMALHGTAVTWSLVAVTPVDRDALIAEAHTLLDNMSAEHARVTAILEALA